MPDYQNREDKFTINSLHFLLNKKGFYMQKDYTKQETGYFVLTDNGIYSPALMLDLKEAENIQAEQIDPKYISAKLQDVANKLKISLAANATERYSKAELLRCMGVAILSEQTKTRKIYEIYMPKYNDLADNAFNANSMFNNHINTSEQEQSDLSL